LGVQATEIPDSEIGVGGCVPEGEGGVCAGGGELEVAYAVVLTRTTNFRDSIPVIDAGE